MSISYARVTAHLFSSRARHNFFSFLRSFRLLDLFFVASSSWLSKKKDDLDGVSEGIAVFPPIAFTAD